MIPQFRSINWKWADEDYFKKTGERITTTEYGYINSIHFFTIFHDEKEKPKKYFLVSRLTGFSGRLEVKSMKEGKMMAKQQLKIFIRNFIRCSIKSKKKRKK